MKALIALFMSLVYSMAHFQVGSAIENVELYPILDGIYNELPKKFRTMQDPIPDTNVNLEGFRDLRASGSGQYYEQGIKLILERIPTAKNIFFIDLREESHIFINGNPVSWVDGPINRANVGKTLQQIENDERQRILDTSEKGVIEVLNKNKDHVATYRIDSIQTERELIHLLGYQYYRLPVTNHVRPSDAIVDQFVNIILTLPEDAWLHFHCRAGSGRTTTFLVMYDMILNAKKVSFDDIIKRQNLIGGKNLMKTDPLSYKHLSDLERMEFIKKFYEYCKEVPDFAISWSHFIKA